MPPIPPLPPPARRPLTLRRLRARWRLHRSEWASAHAPLPDPPGYEAYTSITGLFPSRVAIRPLRDVAHARATLRAGLQLYREYYFPESTTPDSISRRAWTEAERAAAQRRAAARSRGVDPEDDEAVEADEAATEAREAAADAADEAALRRERAAAGRAVSSEVAAGAARLQQLVADGEVAAAAARRVELLNASLAAFGEGYRGVMRRPLDEDVREGVEGGATAPAWEGTRPGGPAATPAPGGPVAGSAVGASAPPPPASAPTKPATDGGGGDGASGGATPNILGAFGERASSVAAAVAGVVTDGVLAASADVASLVKPPEGGTTAPGAAAAPRARALDGAVAGIPAAATAVTTVRRPGAVTQRAAAAGGFSRQRPGGIPLRLSAKRIGRGGGGGEGDPTSPRLRNEPRWSACVRARQNVFSFPIARPTMRSGVQTFRPTPPPPIEPTFRPRPTTPPFPPPIPLFSTQ